ncbi:hypothetical protein KIW84_055784 [Lathyrus oleraceus]|uniref:Uncharacterized protein n=1 Tax=Pisum sativum TaxID=3888 RepID=A0A9D5AG55_PEA|nr:hypothetical protein KIW84_055784 [Pisum sativum]
MAYKGDQSHSAASCRTWHPQLSNNVKSRTTEEPNIAHKPFSASDCTVKYMEQMSDNNGSAGGTLLNAVSESGEHTKPAQNVALVIVVSSAASLLAGQVGTDMEVKPVEQHVVYAKASQVAPPSHFGSPINAGVAGNSSDMTVQQFSLHSRGALGFSKQSVVAGNGTPYMHPYQSSANMSLEKLTKKLNPSNSSPSTSNYSPELLQERDEGEDFFPHSKSIFAITYHLQYTVIPIAVRVSSLEALHGRAKPPPEASRFDGHHHSHASDTEGASRH